jgi:hypothetical protein
VLRRELLEAQAAANAAAAVAASAFPVRAADHLCLADIAGYITPCVS